MTMNVTQKDDELTITGSVSAYGETVQFPAITGTISDTGFFTATAGGTTTVLPDPECGSITTASFTLTFRDDTARYHESVTYSFCGRVAFDAQLTRS